MSRRHPVKRLTPMLALAALLLVLVPVGGAASGHANYHAVCPASPFAVHCHAKLLENDLLSPNAKGQGKPGGGGGGVTNPTPRAGSLGPQQLAQAYSLASPSGSLFSWNGKTIAIVDAYDLPTAEADLNTFSSYFGIPPCTTANGCFQKVKQVGKVRADQGWGLEIALDIEAAHALCPQCKILLVEAKSNSFSDLLAAENYATSHADAVSNSWGANEFSSETSYDSYFNKPGVAITVSSGDSGYHAEYPAASQYVTAVGGTTLTLNADGTRASETAWSGSGSGCSAYEPKPSWQTSVTQCSRRAIADVAAVADPATGLAVYDSYGYSGQSGWFRVGGTSLSAPLVAAIYAQAGGYSGVHAASLPWTTGGLFDVQSGSNGSCSTFVWCHAGSGWDGPTGLGAPSGLAGF